MSSVAPNVPPFVYADGGRIRQVLLNLLSNAVKFTERGEVVVRVALDRSGDGKPRLRFEVSDTGEGIAPDVQARLFQPFSQGDSSSARRHGGSGLGLAICRRLVELMDGEIGVRSVPGRGSTFWFVIPASPCDAGPVRPAVAPAALLRMRIAMVDDNETNLLILEQQLRSWGLRPDRFLRAAEAFDALRRAAEAAKPYDVLLTDMVMPGVDGAKLVAMVRSEPRLDALRIVVMSSWGQTPETDALKATRGLQWLAKPVRQSQLWDALVHGAPGTSDEAIAAKAEPPPAGGAGLSGRVLLVEDNPVNRMVALRQLATLGCTEVDTANNGIEALTALRGTPYRLVVMDCQMPEMDGYEASRRIREMEAAGESARSGHTPIVAMTAHALKGDRERCLAVGMDDYIAKPIRLEELRRILANWLGPEAQGPRADGGR
jgi:two-component system sensor histidine kinase/response regulator